MKTNVSPVFPYQRPSRKNRVILLSVTGVLLFELLSFLYFYWKNPVNNPFRLITDFYLIIRLLKEMLPPQFSLLFQSWDLWINMGETLSMALLGTLFGGIIAFVICFFAARNTSPHAVIKHIARTMLAVLRVAPDYAIMLIIVIAVGFGPFAGTLAIVVGSTGMFGKFFADAVEHIDQKEYEGVRVVGSDWFQNIRFGVVPQVQASFVANMCFFFEINLGAAIALGAFGGGGLGFHLNIANDSLNYKATFAYLVAIIIMRVTTEWVSDRLRNWMFREAALLR